VKPHGDLSDLTERIDALLPQTQCRQCGYAGCRPYAEAISSGAADINRCPPGGNEVIAELAELLQRPPLPLDTLYGVTQAPAVALIDEAWCIGCTLCIQACPVDAIAGAAKVMHTVIAEECTGCALCIPPCPVDCIAMVPVDRSAGRDAQRAVAAHARRRYTARMARTARLTHARLPPLVSPAVSPTADTTDTEAKREAIKKALARARERLKK
jgi:electron transport complex protein RnfB